MTYLSEAQSNLQSAPLDMISHQTPFFLVDLSKIDTAYKALSSALQGFELFYALKANAEPAIIQRLNELGSRFEIASVNELRLLLKQNVAVDRISYSNPVKPWQHIKESFGRGIRCFAFDSAGELEKLAAFAPGAKVYLRFRVDDKGSAFPLSKKFGAEPQDIVALMLQAKSLGLLPYGLTFHVGSQSHDADRWEQAIATAGAAMVQLQESSIHLEVLNIGGGFPAHYGQMEPSLHSIGKVIRSAIRRSVPYKVRLLAEPGRAMVAESAVLVTSIIGRAKRGSKHWLYLDVGAFSGMMETLETRNRFKYPIGTSLSVAKLQKMTRFTLTGPTCDPQDTMFYDLPLPDNLAVGDRIYINTAGAYTNVYASRFNGFAIPKVIFNSQTEKI